jgi:hypothetical protein
MRSQPAATISPRRTTPLVALEHTSKRSTLFAVTVRYVYCYFCYCEPTNNELEKSKEVNRSTELNRPTWTLVSALTEPNLKSSVHLRFVCLNGKKVPQFSILCITCGCHSGILLKMTPASTTTKNMITCACTRDFPRDWFEVHVAVLPIHPCTTTSPRSCLMPDNIARRHA